MTRDSVVSIAIAIGGLLTGFLFAIDGDSWMRAVLTTLFLLIGPGLAITRMMRIEDSMTEVTLAVATSLGLETMVATALLVTGFWSPGTALAIVISITLGCVVIAFARQQDQPAGDGFRQAAEAALRTVDKKGSAS